MSSIQRNNDSDLPNSYSEITYLKMFPTSRRLPAGVARLPGIENMQNLVAGTPVGLNPGCEIHVSGR